MTRPLVFLFFVLLQVISWSGFATQRMSGPQFKALVEQTQKNCPRLNCPRTALSLRPLTTQELKALSPKVKAILMKAFGQVADLWPDTILEGGFTTDFTFHLEKAQVVTYQGEDVGLRFSFSSRAWDEDRTAGRIIDNGFISKDTSRVFRDEKALAHFVADRH